MSAPTVATKWVYDFHEGSREMRNLLGGKGSGVAEMTRILGPGLVPEGFTVTTDACVEYMRRDRTPPDGLAEAVDEALARLETRPGRRLGDSDDPLLVSVRSGARDSMPGMMDTVLNLGLNDESVRGLAARTGDERFAWDSYRRLVQMFGNVVCGVPGERFEDAIAEAKPERGVTLDTELDVAALRELTRRFQTLYDFPADPREQLERAIRAVFDSWSGERAVAYRRINGIPDDWGTAVNVQQMVFGNRGERSCSGVAFSRDEITGAPEPSGDFLRNAQGEDVVSGVRTPDDLSELRDWMPEIHAQLMDILRTLERHYRRHAGHGVHRRGGAPLHAADAQRQAARPGRRALRRRCRRRGPSDRRRRDPDDRRRPARRAAAPDVRPRRRATRCSRAASRPRRAPPRARSCSPPRTPWRPPPTAGRSSSCARSPRPTTSPASTPRAASSPPKAARHRTPPSWRAAWAAPRSPASAALDVDLHAREVRIGERVLHEGDLIAIDGTTGAVTTDDVPLVAPPVDDALRDRARMVRRPAHARRARQRRHARRRAPRTFVRRRGDRAVPDGAHVHGRRPPAQDAGGDHGRRRRRAGAPRSMSCCRSSRPTSRACSRRWTSCR